LEIGKLNSPLERGQGGAESKNMPSETNLEKQILATVVYYNILDYPLTCFEIFLYLVKIPLTPFDKGGNCSQFSILNSLDTSKYLKKYLDQKYGFYFLKNRNRWLHSPEGLWSSNAEYNHEKNLDTNGLHSLKGTMEPAKTNEKIDIVQQRLERKKLADWKWKKARKIFRITQIIPFMKMVLVSGSLAFGNSKDESDIDVIIIAKKGRIWTVRAFATLLTCILGVRRHSKITKNKICLNHYITDQSLKIPFESLYNAQSYVHLVNVYRSQEDERLFEEFQKENKWIKKYVENYEVSELENFRGIRRNKILGFISKIFEIILSGKHGIYLEKKLSEIQSRKIKNNPLYEKAGGRITANDNQLEFHPNSHEARIIPKFNQWTKKLGLFEFAGQKDSGLRHRD